MLMDSPRIISWKPRCAPIIPCSHHNPNIKDTPPGNRNKRNLSLLYGTSRHGTRNGLDF